MFDRHVGRLLLSFAVAFAADYRTNAEESKRPWTVPKSSAPEYGHALTAKEALTGWISLFDGKTSFGWQRAQVTNGQLAGGESTAHFGNCEIRLDVANSGRAIIAGVNVEMKMGLNSFRLENVETVGPVKLRANVVLNSLVVRPTGLKQQFDGKDFSGWKLIRHPRLTAEKQATWRVVDGVIHARGGPGALELQKRFGNLLLQFDVRTRKPLVNGGLFFRSIPGDFMNGYEAQLFNACYDNDPAQPARYSTGAIDDRQLARRLVSRDETKFTMTVLAHGPHIATWVNGYQTTDWTDKREPHENPRRGLRTKPGTIQLQAHDPESDLEFSNIRIVELAN